MKKIHTMSRLFIVIFFGLILLLPKTHDVYAAYTTSVSLGNASSFAILAGSAITNTGTTNISGTAGNNIGVHPGTSITEDAGPIILVSGNKYNSGEQIVSDAKDALNAAIVDIQGRTTTGIINEELGGALLVPGIYSSDAGYFGLTGTLTLDAENDPNAVFIFKMASTLTTADMSNVSLINGADACRIFWQVGSSATLGTNSNFGGHILADQSITVTTGAVVNGSLLTLDAAVTLDSNTIVNNVCAPTTATLTIVKNVINDNSGNSIASDFLINVRTNNIDVIGSPASGSTTGISYTLAPGVYTISEPNHAGYDMSFSGDIDANGTITLVAGESRTITLINNDVPPVSASSSSTATLIVIKNVINDNEGNNIASDFLIHVKSNNVDVDGSPAIGSTTGTAYVLEPGVYVISEPAHSGYSLSYSGEVSENGTITLIAGETRTITLNNNDLAPSGPATRTTQSSPLPNTSSDLEILILLGGLLTIVGALGWYVKRKI